MALTKVQAEGINLADTFAFTGTVNGTGTRQLLRTITVSSDTASVEFKHNLNGVVLDSTYSRYEITIDSCIGGTNSNGQQLAMYLSNNLGVGYFGASAYNTVFHRHYSNGSSTGDDSGYQNDFALNHADGVSTATNRGGVTGTIIVDNLGTAHRTVFNGQFFGFGSGGYYIHTNSIGTVESFGDTYNAIKLAMVSGDIGSGIFKLYGVR